MNKVLKKIAFAVIASLSLAACTDVDICMSDEHPHLGIVELSYDWNGVEVNDSMVVMPYRITPNWSCVYICSPDGVRGHYISNSPDSVPTNDTLKVKAGELRFLTFSYDTDNNGFTYKNALSDTAVNRNSVAVEYKSYKLSAPVIQEAFGAEVTALEKAGCSYVLNGNMFNHIYSQYTAVTEIKNGTNAVEFAPKSILNDYEFSFDISAQDVTVDKVIASLSGIPYRYNFTEERPDADSTATVLFDVTSAGTSKYTGKAVVTGLLRAANANSTSGAGILELAIWVTNASGSKKVYRISTNLYNYIPGLDNLLCGTNSKFNVDAPVVITNEGIDVSIASSNGALWSKMR